jgi:hypothetical protein
MLKEDVTIAFEKLDLRNFGALDVSARPAIACCAAI